MDSFSFSLAFTAGALSVGNPCAVAMVPAYIAMRVDAGGRATGALVATGVGGLVVGFVGTFALVGLALSLAGRALAQYMPFAAGAIGLILVAIGLRTLILGRPLHIPMPPVPIRGGPESGAGQVVFGATYAFASLGCALPVFLAYAATALSMDALAFALDLVAFSAGAAAMLLLVVVVALAARGVGTMPIGRALTRYAGGLLVTFAGLYVAYLQLGWLIGYPFGIPNISLPL